MSVSHDAADNTQPWDASIDDGEPDDRCQRCETGTALPGAEICGACRAQTHCTTCGCDVEETGHAVDCEFHPDYFEPRFQEVR